MLDLLIRQQIKDRGRIISAQKQTKHRLVEPISLTDEFESWTFDHFHGLFDFWLVCDANSQLSFPNSWTLNANTKIDYLISNGSISDTNDSLIKHIERPNTKSLESFIEDICKIENNGMYLTWYKALAIEENITTYAHLTNLNQKEWERIKHLSMNALKTIKFYIDQEKQLVEQRKTQETHQDESYSKAEIRANLHMIKLYFIRQLEHIEGIKPIPRLDCYCVKTAFIEMREEGYEDDGLFDQMKLFFQPLTVVDEELTINEQDLRKLKDNDEKEKKRLEGEITSYPQLREQKNKEIGKLNTEIDNIKNKRLENFADLNKKVRESQNQPYDKQIKLESQWAEIDDSLEGQLKTKYEELTKYMNDLSSIENKQIDDKKLLEIITQRIDSIQTTIDRKLVKPHRGFIMYGPPGKNSRLMLSNTCL